MNKLPIYIVILLIFLSCGDADCDDEFNGNWRAKWTTLPESFQGIDNITSYEMNGNFIFQCDSVTVVANGFPGCVFGVDTLSHKQTWKIEGDTALYLISEGNLKGISYQINKRSNTRIELQLMEDIFLTLQRD